MNSRGNGHYITDADRIKQDISLRTRNRMLSPGTMTLVEAKTHLAFWFDQIDTINNPVDRRAVELVGQWLDGRTVK